MECTEPETSGTLHQSGEYGLPGQLVFRRPRPPAIVPTSPLLRGATRIVQPMLVEEIAEAVGPRSPYRLGNRVDCSPKLALFGDVHRRAQEFDDVSGCVGHRVSHNANHPARSVGQDRAEFAVPGVPVAAGGIEQLPDANPIPGGKRVADGFGGGRSIPDWKAQQSKHFRGKPGGLQIRRASPTTHLRSPLWNA